MKYLVLAMAAVSGLAIAAPATAQSQYPYGQPQSPYRADVNAEADFSARFDERIDRIEERLEAGIDAGTINRTESRALRTQVRTLTRLERQYAYNGFTAQERQDLQLRLRTLRQDLRVADGGAAYRDERYGSRDDGWGDDDGYSGRGGPYDQDGDGWDDRDCDRDGDVDNGSCDTGAGRTGLGGFIDSILGSGGLRVGQRVNGELYAVPSQYRDRYRDGSGYYYRSDGRRIYQIDARTNVVARVHPMP